MDIVDSANSLNNSEKSLVQQQQRMKPRNNTPTGLDNREAMEALMEPVMDTVRLLLVEDHPMTLMGLRLLLQQAGGFEIAAEATTGRLAVLKAAETQPDLILMDIGLPEMDGIAATQQIKQAHPHIKVLMLTSKDDEQDVMAAMAAGADGYCMKGIATEPLSAAIRSVAGGAAWLDPAVARIVLSRFQGVSPGTLNGNGGNGFSAGTSSTALASGASAQVSQATQNTLLDCPLTPRELEVLRLIVDGHSNPQIAEKLVVTKATAKAHVHSILQKLCVDDRTQAAVLAMRQGLV
ncbi:MAG: response regulator transcription factor [Vampirovibrionales bacterium]|nr:response regulator transcription factor [Vampirovibrionales bacterium]